MDTAKSVFLAVTVILFALGAWPIALITLTVFATLSVVQSFAHKKEHEKLLNEITELHQRIEKLESEIIVTKVVRGTDNKER